MSTETKETKVNTKKRKASTKKGSEKKSNKKARTKYCLDIVEYGGDGDYGALTIDLGIGVEEARDLALEQGGKEVKKWPSKYTEGDSDDEGALEDDCHYCKVSTFIISNKKDRDIAAEAARKVADGIDEDHAKHHNVAVLTRDDDQPKINEILKSRSLRCESCDQLLEGAERDTCFNKKCVQYAGWNSNSHY
jgi:hypothetical protein